MAEVTDFNETAALLALLRGDEAAAERLLEDSLAGELRALGDAADRLSALCRRAELHLEHQRGRHAGMARTGVVSSESIGCPDCQVISGIPKRKERPGG